MTIAVGNVAASATSQLSLAAKPDATVTVTCVSANANIRIDTTFGGAGKTNVVYTFTVANYNVPQNLVIWGTRQADSGDVVCTANEAGGYAGNSCASATVSVSTAHISGAAVNMRCGGRACLSATQLAIPNPVTCDDSYHVSLKKSYGSICVTLGSSPDTDATVTCTVLAPVSSSYGAGTYVAQVATGAPNALVWGNSATLTFAKGTQATAQTVQVVRNVADEASAVTCKVTCTGDCGYNGETSTVIIASNTSVNFNSASTTSASIMFLVIASVVALWWQ